MFKSGVYEKFRMFVVQSNDEAQWRMIHDIHVKARISIFFSKMKLSIHYWDLAMEISSSFFFVRNDREGRNNFVVIFLIFDKFDRSQRRMNELLLLNVWIKLSFSCARILLNKMMKNMDERSFLYIIYLGFLYLIPKIHKLSDFIHGQENEDIWERIENSYASSTTHKRHIMIINVS